MPAECATTGIHDIFQHEKHRLRRELKHSTETLVGMRAAVEDALEEVGDQVVEVPIASELSNIELARLLFRGLLGLKRR